MSAYSGIPGDIFTSLAAREAYVEEEIDTASTPPSVKKQLLWNYLASETPQKSVIRPVYTVDRRKFKYDIEHALSKKELDFGAQKADRLSAEKAGLLLHEIHQMVGIENEPEDVILAFDRALWFEHSINGASGMRDGSVMLQFGNRVYPVAAVVEKLGNRQRSFYRAFADDIADALRRVLNKEDRFDAVLIERAGWILQLAEEKGLRKFPYLIHDSADACVRLTPVERVALMASKASALKATR